MLSLRSSIKGWGLIKVQLHTKSLQEMVSRTLFSPLFFYLFVCLFLCLAVVITVHGTNEVHMKQIIKHELRLLTSN